MREIKYRAWERDRQLMNYKVMVGNTDGEDDNYTCSIIWNCDKKVWLHFDKGSDIELMEYTGLKDKNGKEIFEGDILYHKLQGKRVVYYPFNEYVASYGLREISNGFCSTLQDSHRVYELIGNIHENPELLER